MDKQDFQQFKLHQQYLTRRPVNILVSSKLGCFNPNDLFAANNQLEVDIDLPPPSEEEQKQIEVENEILSQVLQQQKKQIEQSYLWDRDEADEKKSSQKIAMNEEGTIFQTKKDRSSIYQKGSKKPNDDLQKSGHESFDKQNNQKGQQRQLDTKLNDQYFSVVYEANLDFLIKKISLQVQQNQKMGALGQVVSGASSMLNFISRNTIGQFMSAQLNQPSENNEEGWCLLQQPGKRIPSFDSDITASAAYGDNLVLGFANGALVVIDTSNDSVPAQILYCNENFVSGGPQQFHGNAISKIKILYFNELRAKGQDGALSVIAPKEQYILCLARQNLFCLSLPNFETKDLLEAEQIIDFETYTTPILVGQGGQRVDQDCLVILSQTKVLKIFKFIRAEKCYKYVTKISLSLMTVPSPQQFMNIIKNENQNSIQKIESLPIFDGGIAVYRDHFIVQYRDCAEYIQIQNKGNLFLETITKFKLWDNRKQNKRILNSQKNASLIETQTRQRASSQAGQQTGLAFDNQLGENLDENQADQVGDESFENMSDQQDKENDFNKQFETKKQRSVTIAFAEKQQNIFGKILSKQSKQNSNVSSNEGKNLGYPAPIFDEFLKAFIITQDDQSFYLDLLGNYDSKFRPIQWSERVMILRLVSPYLVAYLSDNSIEVRNIFNPNRIFNKHELVSQSQFISMAVSNNLLMKNNGRLDDFYVIVKNQPSKSLLDMQRLTNQEVGGVGGFLTRASIKTTISQGHQIGDEILSLIKFKQQEPQYQLVFLTKSHLYATFLKLVDYLEDKGLRGGVTAQTYQKNLQKLAFYNFYESRRFYVTRNIIDRLQIQLPLVVSLFSFIYPEGYLNRLFEMFQIDKKELPFFKTNKKIPIYQYFIKLNDRFKNIAFGKKAQNNEELQFDDNNLSLSTKQEEKQKEDESLIKELRNKIDQSSQATLVDYTQRMKPGKDPHYQKIISEPASILTKNDMESIRIFLPFFLRQKIYLRRQLLFLNTGSYFQSLSDEQQIEKNIQKLSQDKQDPLGTNFSPQQAQSYLQNYTEAQILYLLQLCEMIIFHSLIFLLSSKWLIDKSEQKNLYQECYEEMIKQNFPKFVNDIYDAKTAEEIYERTKQQTQTFMIDGFEDEKKENVAYSDIKIQDKSKNIEQQEIFNKQVLPPFFVLDLLFKYGKFEDVCRYLFYRKEFKELLFLIKLEYQEAKKTRSEIKKQINIMEQNGSDTKTLKDQEQQIDKTTQKWLKYHIEFIQKINDFQHYVPLEANWSDELAEEYCDRNSEWVLKERPDKWIECFKKWSNRNDVIKLREKDLEQKSNSNQIPNVFKKQDEPVQNNLQQQIVCNQPPFMSKKLLQNIGKFKGSIKLGVSYLEYVILKCRVANRGLHTELGEIYIQFITSIVKKQHKAVLQDYEKSENEETITKDSFLIQDILKKLKDCTQFKDYRDRLRIFLTSSSLYDPSHLEDIISRPDLNLEEQKEDLDDAGKLEIIMKKVFKEVLMKEVAILKMKMMQYKECMEICIGQVKDWQFAQSLARRGFEWHKRDKRIHLQLFQRLLDNGNVTLEELGLKKIENSDDQITSITSRKLAVHICTENADQVPYKKVCASLNEDDLVNEDVNMLLARLLQAANKDLALSKMFCGLTTIHKQQLEFEKVNLAQQSIKITAEDTDSSQFVVSKCDYCSKPIGVSQIRFDPKLKQVYHAYHFQEDQS